MNKIGRILIITFLSVAITVAEFSVQADVDRSQMGPDEVVDFVLRFSGSGDLPNIKLPALADFDLVGTSRMSRFNMINGAVTRGLELHHQLRPKRTGSLTIPGFKVEAEGKSYATQPITIQVSGTKSPSQVNPSKASSPLFLEASTLKPRYYLGEPIVYWLRINNQLQLFGEPTLKDPVFRNLSRLGQKPPLQRQEVKTLNGRQYQVNNIFIHLNPLSVGEAGVDPMSLIFSLSPFDPNREVRSNAVALSILPIPRNADFDQAIGQFKLSMTVSPQTLRANEAATIKVTISGQGNLKLAVAPHFSLPKDIEAYTPKAQLSETLTETGLNAEKTFEQTWIPRSAGDYSIPSGKWVYFDPTSERFITLMTGVIPLHVEKGPARTAMLMAANPVVQEAADIRYLHQEGDDWGRGMIKWGGLMAFLSLLAVGIRYRRFTASVRSWFGRLRPEARLFKRLETAMSTPNRFYGLLLKAVTTVLIDHYHFPAGELTTEGLRKKYPQADWVKDWQTLEAKSYQPELTPSMEEMTQSIQTMITFIQTVRKNK